MSNGARILQGLREAAAYARGEAVQAKEHHRIVANTVDVSAIRQKLGLSQREFALKFGFSLGTLRHWEQGQRLPDGPARILLTIIDRDPEAVERALKVA
jgi:putative transcriptional regulator